MKVALIEYKVRIMPPADASNEVMDEALDLVAGSYWIPVRRILKRDVEDRLLELGLESMGFTVEVTMVVSQTTADSTE
jgi:hypothetical protein